MKLYIHQQDLIEKNPKRHLLAWECGLGKTLTAIKIAEKNGHNILVICPKSLIENWQREIKLYGYSGNESFWKVISKENFRKEWNKEEFYDVIIFDEAHYFSGIKSQMHKSAFQYLKKHKPECIYLLTATPYMSTPFNIMALERLLGIDRGYMWYKQTFFYEVKMGARMIPIIKKNIETKIELLVRHMGSVVKKGDALDLPDQVYQTEYFELTLEQKRAYQKINNDPRIGVPIVKWTKKHQVNGGTLKLSENKTSYNVIRSEKLDRLVEYAMETPKLAVVCRYNAEIDVLLGTLKDKNIPVYVIQGETKDKDKVVQNVNESKRCVVLINNACCEGYNLTGINIMVFYSHDFSLKNYIQVCGRIHRIGQAKKCTYIDYVVRDTIDEDVVASLRNKESFDIEIYAKKRSKV